MVKQKLFFTLSFVLLCNLLFADWGIDSDRKGWGIRATQHKSGGVLNDDQFNAADGFITKKMGYSVFVGRYNISEINPNVWRSLSYGITYRQLNFQSKTSSTRFNFSALEFPLNLNLCVHGGGRYPLALDAGVYVSVPLKYEGYVYRYQQTEYEYGREKYEKPYCILGLRGGVSIPLDLFQRIRITPFAHFNFGLIPAVPGAPDGVEPVYDAAIYRCGEIGVEFVLWNKG